MDFSTARLVLTASQARWLAANASRSDFLTSLAVQFGERGSLSVAQVAAINRAMAR